MWLRVPLPKKDSCKKHRQRSFSVDLRSQDSGPAVWDGCQRACICLPVYAWDKRGCWCEVAVGSSFRDQESSDYGLGSGRIGALCYAECEPLGNSQLGSHQEDSHQKASLRYFQASSCQGEQGHQPRSLAGSTAGLPLTIKLRA